MAFFTPELVTACILLGTLAGFLAGLLGIGGGIILVPLFLWTFPLLGVDPNLVAHTAFGTSLTVIIPTALSSTLGHRKRGNVQWDQVLFLAIGGGLGAIGGSSLAAGLSASSLKALFGLMQIGVALRMFLVRPHLPPEREGAPSVWSLMLVGAIGGAFSAFFGVGGGVVAVPLMVVGLSLPIHLAVGNSSALIVISSLFGSLGYIFHGRGIPGLPELSLGYVVLPAALLVAPFTMVFARLGVRVASRIPHDRLVKVFALVLFLVGIRMALPFMLD